MEQTDYQFSASQLCDKHKRAKLTYARLSPDSQNPFLCSVCQIQSKSKAEILISIEEVLYSDNNEPIQNWPPGIDSKTLSFLKYKQNSLVKEEMHKGINNFYQQLKFQILQILVDSERQQLAELDKFQIGFQELIDLYNSLFKRQELTDIFKDKEVFSQVKYLSLLTTLSQSSKKDLQKLHAKVKEKKEIEKNFRIFQTQKLQDLFDSIILKANELAPTTLLQQEDNDLIEEELCFTPFPTPGEYEKNAIYEELWSLQQKVHKYENKSQLMMRQQSKFEIVYKENQIIQISNPHKKSGGMQPSFYTSNKLSFQLKFNNIISLRNFNLTIFLKADEREFETTELLQEIQQYFKYSQQTPLQFQVFIDISNNSIELSTDNFSQKQDIDSEPINDTEFSYFFSLNGDCEGFGISQYKEIPLTD